MIQAVRNFSADEIKHTQEEFPRGRFFDQRNLPDDFWDDEPLTEEESHEFNNAKHWLMDENEFEYFQLTGMLPVDWEDRVKKEQSEAQEEAQEPLIQQPSVRSSFTYERGTYTPQQQRDHYITAYRLSEGVREQISGCSKKLWFVTGAAIITTVVLSFHKEVNHILKGVGGGTAVIISGSYRQRVQQRRKNLSNQIQQLEYIMGEYEEEHLTDADQEFYKAYRIPINVKTHQPKRVDLAEGEYTPSSKVEEIVIRVGTGVEYVVTLVQGVVM